MTFLPEPNASVPPCEGSQPATLADIYAALGIGADEHVSICHTPNGKWHSRIHTAAQAANVVSGLTGNVYFGINPTSLPVGTKGSRGRESDVTRLAALPADLDVKDGACPDLATAHAIIEDMSEVLGTHPVAVISSGKGLQPIWSVTDCDATQGCSLLRRFGRLVAACSLKRDVKVDTVFDLVRVLRVPGTLNYKYDPPLPTSATLNGGTPLTAAEVGERLRVAGISEQPEDTNINDGVVVSDPNTWAYADKLCGYAKSTVIEWKTDNPTNGRHPMLMSNLVRLACMWRHGCLPKRKTLEQGIVLVANRHRWLCENTEPSRLVAPYEIPDAWAWAVQRVSTMTDEQVAGELGDHDHSGNNASSSEGWLSDANISQLLVDRVLRGKYCWAAGLGWMGWDGKKWCRTTNEDVIEQSRLFARRLVADQVAAGVGQNTIKAYVKRLNAGAINAAANLARGQLQLEASQFDAHPDLLNVNNGVIDLKTGTRMPHDPKLLFTKCAPTDYNPQATHPDWVLALGALPDQHRKYLQHRFGQGITGHPTPDDVMPVLHGGGSNGKTTITTGIMRALGDHVTVVPDRVLLGNPSDHPTELMTLRGARLALLEETPEARYLNVKRLKDVLGTTVMTARHIRQDSVSWSVSHSLFVSTNYRPRVEETDHGTWRRLLLVEFPFTYRRRHEKLVGANDRYSDPTLRERIKLSPDGQHEAILRWIVDGAVGWYRNGKVMQEPPQSVVDATHDWRLQADSILRFYEDHLIADEKHYITGQDMFSVFSGWLRTNGHRPWTTQTFADRFGQHDSIVNARIFAGRIYTGRTKLVPSRPKVEMWETLSKLGSRPRVWTGVRFRTAADEGEGENAAESTTQPMQDSTAGDVEW